jgi:hypothetical protein
MNWSGNLFQTFATRIGKLFFLKLVLNRCIESVQKRATKQIQGFHNLSYPERIKKLKLPTIAHRRIRGDMIETYKLIRPFRPLFY